RHRLLAVTVVEGARDLALAVERHRALLHAPHHQHRPKQPDAVLEREMSAYLGRLRAPFDARGPGALGALRDVSGHPLVFPSRRGPPGSPADLLTGVPGSPVRRV